MSRPTGRATGGTSSTPVHVHDVRGRPDAREMGWAALAALAIAATYVAIASAHGALGAARNDDWAFYRVAFDFARTGTFRLNGWPSMMLVGQALLAWPVVKVFGAHIATLQVSVAILGAVGLWATYLLVRSFESRGWAALAVGCLAFGPVYGTLSVSFMTDVPSFAFEVLALLVGLRALRSARVSASWFVASLGLGLVAFSIREYAVAAGATVCLVVLLRTFQEDRPRLRRFVLLSAAWLLVLVLLFAWRSGLPHSLGYQQNVSLRALGRSVETMWHAALTLGLFVSPAVLALSPVKLVEAVWRRARIGGAVVVGASVVLTAVARPIFVGNYFARIGSYTVLLSGNKPALVDHRIWDLLGLIGFASIVAVALLAVLTLTSWRRGRPPSLQLETPAAQGRALVCVFSAVTLLIILTVITVTTAPFFDRYFIVLVPFVVALTVQAARREDVLARRAATTATTSLVVLAMIGLLWVDASATFDGGRWRLATSVEAQGYAPATIDGGLEWFAYQQPDDVHQRTSIAGRGFWVTLFGPRPVCVTITLPTGGTTDIPGAEVPPRVIQERTARTLTGVDYRFIAVAGPQRCTPTTHAKG